MKNKKHMKLSLFGGGKRHEEINAVVLLDVEKIRPNPHQPREYFDERYIQDLAESIERNGLLQPITVRELDQDAYELISGERRLTAYRLLQRESIPAIIEEYTERQSAILAVIENLQRKDLNFIEEANGIRNLMEITGLNQQQISLQLGQAQSTIANKLRLMRFSKEIQSQMIENGLTERHARALLALTEDRLLSGAIETIRQNDMTVIETEEMVRRLNAGVPGGEVDGEKRKRKIVVKDLRIFQNSINKAISVMNLSGIPAETVKRETEEYLEYTIRIPKESAYQNSILQKQPGS
ncbi:ParB/RepB/Spo0J family partition protein [Ruminococcaceae bacterium OttesenSCG-928-L11]|nr:ParB/RepB/Spo0J family partition protein [Ruminococcaceae bacterium OttesenSCG-928-L11]